MTPITEREEAEAEITSTDSDGPSFSISEAALFFGRTTQWLRWRSEQLTNEHPDEFQVPRGNNGYRRYTLDTIQSLAELLAKYKRLSPADSKAVLTRVAAFRE